MTLDRANSGDERDRDVSDRDRRPLREIEMVGRERHEEPHCRAGVSGSLTEITYGAAED